MSSHIREVSLQTETEKRYLNYALSVISSRALPDVRDGLKPVQRRILYAMYHHLKLLPSAKFRKSAAVTGEVMGKYHPHGDQAIYDAMVRMAQYFSLLHPLVDGYGNFGSIDGDKAAAYRYTEARLQPITLELLEELKQETVDTRPNFDGTLQEPVVLPAKFPNLLVNGSSGIAVGMATNIPPHNLGEVMDALLLVLDQPEASTREILKRIKGPDFPTGGEIVATREERVDIYQKGQGNLQVRGEWKEERKRGKNKKGKRLVIFSTPYNVTRSTIVEKIAEVIMSKKLPPLLDVRDESTEQTRVVLELKANADADMVMAYLYKHTNLQSRFSVNLTCLVPTPNPLVAAPERLSLKQILEQFLEFRLEVIDRRFRHELAKLRDRIHILEGFGIVFNALDEAIRIIRASDGRKDSHEKLKARFKLSDRQTEAILDTRLYRLARLEINEILAELAKLQARAAEIETILGDRRLLKGVLRDECTAFRETYAVPRVTRIREGDKTPELQEDAFIEEEQTHIVLTRDGWVKRIRTINSSSNIRVREGDEILAIMPGSTKETVCFFTDLGMAYTARIWDIQATAGYGVPLQNLFKFKDGERVVGGLSLDPTMIGDIAYVAEVEESTKASFAPDAVAKAAEQALDKADSADAEPPVHLLVVTQNGYGSRLSLAPYYETSTKAGRRYTRPSKGDQVLHIEATTGKGNLVLASQERRYLLFPVSDVKFLGNPGKGVGLMRLDEGDVIYGAAISTQSDKGLLLETTEDEEVLLSPSNAKGIGKRLTKGTRKRGVKGWKRVIPPPLLPWLDTKPATPATPSNDADGAGPETADGTADGPANAEDAEAALRKAVEKSLGDDDKDAAQGTLNLPLMHDPK